MRNRLIPHAAWFTYLQDFTRRHHRWPTTVWFLSPRLGAQVEARDLPLEVIESDPLATSISIQLGGSPGRNLDHTVSHPMTVWAELNDQGEEAALGINCEDGSSTVLELRSLEESRVSKRMKSEAAACASTSVEAP